ncbi:hypothetical protein JI664_21435 [Rhodobacter sp. NTK016B]|uniref:hypothetical protein n=1 Tax=Rhodobacter sp. NTK016B TaxID=2759676 RepID=UPI001A8C03EF|nr:hypothetical protein [Rhodobacter sp. NTK016B]MBN8294550.1 hypothetical protein [Rhodobacter sp. NTK016B]
MPTVQLSAFLPMMAASAPGLPSFAAEKYLRMAAIEFCERTKCWRNISTVELTDENDEAMAAPDYAAIHLIEWATFTAPNQPAVDLTPTQFSDVGPDADTSFIGSVPRYLTQVSPGTVRVLPFAAGTLTLSLFLKPRHGDDLTNPANTQPLQDYLNQVPEFLLTQHGEIIVDGALSKALLLPQQQWSDPKRAMIHLQRFERSCDRLFATAVTGQQRARKRARIQFF